MRVPRVQREFSIEDTTSNTELLQEELYSVTSIDVIDKYKAFSF
jgi:hypothetical protein